MKGESDRGEREEGGGKGVVRRGVVVHGGGMVVRDGCCWLGAVVRVGGRRSCWGVAVHGRGMVVRG